MTMYHIMYLRDCEPKVVGAKGQALFRLSQTILFGYGGERDVESHSLKN